MGSSSPSTHNPNTNSHGYHFSLPLSPLCLSHSLSNTSHHGDDDDSLIGHRIRDRRCQISDSDAERIERRGQVSSNSSRHPRGCLITCLQLCPADCFAFGFDSSEAIPQIFSDVRNLYLIHSCGFEATKFLVFVEAVNFWLVFGLELELLSSECG
ncbi:hypothetical protein AKJ16_DCAP10073 [Drosera capensis]